MNELCVKLSIIFKLPKQLYYYKTKEISNSCTKLYKIAEYLKIIVIHLENANISIQ